MVEFLFYSLIALLFWFFSLNTLYLIILILSIFEINKTKKNRYMYDINQVFRYKLLPPISIILPAYNEEKTIVESVYSLLFLHYPLYELIVVNDGSKDDTLKILKKSFDLLKTDYVFRRAIPTEPVIDIYVSRTFKNLIVVDKKNGGKADALNVGINISRFPYFCAIDADTILGEDALSKLIRPFIHAPEKTIAVGGVIKAANNAEIQRGRLIKEGLPRNILVLLQTVEYARAFFMGRMGLSTLNSLLIISGAFGLFRKEDVLEAGGYKRGSLGEDMMLVVKLHKIKKEKKEKYRVSFVPDTVSWTEIPSTFKVLRRQRIRWQVGLLESLFENRKMFFNPRYGKIGLFAFPFYFFSEVVSPFLEIFGYGILAYGILINQFFLPHIISFIVLTYGYGLLHSAIGLVLEYYALGKGIPVKNLLIRTLSTLIEPFFYRQINIAYKLAGIFKFFSKKREWGAMERIGFKKET